MDRASIDRLLTTTRSVRRRLDLDREVDLEVVTECLQLALQAPTGSNSQGWSFVVVTDAEKRRGLAELYRRGGGDYLDAQLAAPQSDENRRVFSSAQHLAQVLDKVPVLIIPCIEGRVEGLSNAAAASVYGSILPAVWSLMLALRSRGLGSAWTTFHLVHEAEAARLLGVPETVTQVALLPVAHTKGSTFQPAARRPLADVTHLNSWGSPLTS